MTAINSNRAIRGPVTAVPVVAGKGVRLVADTENNRWVVEADETVLWSGSLGATGSSQALSESIYNFNAIEVHCWPNKNLTTQRAPQVSKFTLPTATSTAFFYCKTQNLESGVYYSEVIYVNVSNGTSFQLAQGHRWQDNTQTKSIDDYRGSVCKIVGIGRKENA